MYIVIFVTCANIKEARRIAFMLVKNKLVACVNIIDKIESVYRWRGKVERAKEVLLILKSKKAKLAKVIKLVKSMHSYEVPEIIALPVTNGYQPYLEWLDESIRESY